MNEVRLITDMLQKDKTEEVKIGKFLGSGTSGSVFCGRWHNLDVAVKVSRGEGGRRRQEERDARLAPFKGPKFGEGAAGCGCTCPGAIIVQPPHWLLADCRVGLA